MGYLIRIDDRLVHGQVVEGWIKPLKIDTVVVCSDIVFSDPVSSKLFEISVPVHVKAKSLSIELTATDIITDKYKNNNVLVLIPSLEDLYELVVKVKQNIPNYVFPEINIGGIRYSLGKVQIYKALFLDKKELEIMKKLNQLGVILEYRVLPKDEKIILNYEIEKIETKLSKKGEEYE